MAIFARPMGMMIVPRKLTITNRASSARTPMSGQHSRPERVDLRLFVYVGFGDKGDTVSVFAAVMNGIGVPGAGGGANNQDVALSYSMARCNRGT